MKCLWKLNISQWMLKTRMFYSEEEARGRSAGIKVDKEESCRATLVLKQLTRGAHTRPPATLLAGLSFNRRHLGTPRAEI